MGDLVGGKVGPVSYDLALVGGKVQISFGGGVEGVSVNVVGLIDARLFLDKLKVIIPGQVDDAIISALEAAFLPA